MVGFLILECARWSRVLHSFCDIAFRARDLATSAPGDEQMKIKSIEVATKRYIQKSTQAYLEGEKSVNWIKGVMQNSISRPEAQAILAGLRGYGDQSRYQQLELWLQSEQ
jgi:hypothetical protein